jgi:hypothetical protein
VSVFNTSFTFQLLSPAGDGFTFAIEGKGGTAIGTGGLGLGYAGISSSAAVAYSLFNDAGTANATGFFSNGSQPSAATSTDLTSTSLNLHSGDQMTATLSYNGTTLTATLTDDVRNISETQTYTTDIPALIGTNQAYVGFTAATGSNTAVQKIKQWTFIPGQPAPSSVTAKAVSSSSIVLGWSEEAKTQSSIIIEQSSDGTDFAPVGVALPEATSFKVGGLQPSTEYWFRLQATNPFSDSGYSSLTNETTEAGSAPAPINYASGFSNASSGLVFDKVPFIPYNGSIIGSEINLTNGSSNEVSDVYDVQPVNISTFSTAFSFQILDGEADGFTFVLQSGGTDVPGSEGGSLGFLGIPNSLAVKFNIFNHISDGSNSTGLLMDGVQNELAAGSINLTPSGINLKSGHVIDVAMTYDGTTLNVAETDTVTKAVATQSYTVDIPEIIGGNKAHVGFTGGSGGLTAVQNILTWTFTPGPTAPVKLTATPASATEIDLAWVDNSTTQTGYIVERSTDDIVFSPIATLGNVDTYKDTSFSGGTTYYYEVLATNGSGTSVPSNVVSAISPNPPAKPSDPQATKITTTEIDLSWVNNADNATNYLILRKDGESGNTNLIATLPPTATTYDDLNLTPGQRYDYHIEAVNISGHTDFAGLAVSTICLPPTQLTAVGGNSEITVSWNASFGATSYIIYRGVGPGLESNAPLFTGITGTSYEDWGVPPNTTYYFHVAAVDSSGQSVQSAETFATSTATPALRVLAVTPTFGGALLPGGAITARLSTDVSQTDSLSGTTFTLTPVGSTTPVLANISYNASTFTATLTPVKPLVAGQKYTAALSPLINDDNFNFLYGGYTWSFTYLAGGPKVVAPSGLTVDEDAELKLSGHSAFTVSDPAAGSAEKLTVSAAKGNIALVSTGLTSVTGNGTSTITMAGSIAALNAALQTLVFEPPTDFSGTSSISLKLTNPQYNLTASASANITVKSAQPVVSVNGPYTIAEGASLKLSATASDPLGKTLTYGWDISGNGTFTDASGKNPTITWAQLEKLGYNDGPMQFFVRVRVSDGVFSTISAPALVTITAVAPTAVFSNSGPIKQGASAVVSFHDQFDPSSLQTQLGFRYSYDFNDDGTYEISKSTSSSVTVPAKYLSKPGPHTIRATIFDNDGKSTSYLTTVEVLAS